MKCEVCGNDYDKSFTITQDGRQHIFDSFECAIHALAPTCAQCGCRIVGHGVEAGSKIYCCATCARHDGVQGLADRITVAEYQQRAEPEPNKRQADRLVEEAGEESFPASDPPAWHTARPTPVA